MHYPNLKTLATFILALSLFVGSVIATESSPPMRGNDRSSAVLMNSPTWEIYLSDYGYSDILNYYRGYSHEMLSGEWGGAVSYERWDPASSTWVPKFSWMDPEWIFPDWMTGSTFAVITPLTVSDSNGDTFFDFGYSEIANDDLMIKITHKFIDARTPMGLGIGTGSSFLSEQWILKEEYEIISVSPEPLRNVCYYRFLHGHPSEDFGSANTYQDYDNTFYSYSDPVWPGQEDYIHDIAQWSDFGGHGGNLGTEYIAFHALQAPSDYGLGDYSGHDYGKPATGLHIDIENTGPLMNNHGLYGPAEVAGAMRWLFGPMDMGSSERIDLILSVGGEEFNECDQCDRLVDHESLAIGQTWGNASGDSPGDLAFTEDGIPVHLGTITLGAYTGFNQAEIVNDPAGCLDNQVMNLNNIANVYDIASAVAGTDSVTFLYTDFGGEENLAVNGYPRYEGDITGAPSNIAPGVTCTVYYTDFGNYRCGKVLLVGDVESLLIAGQEFYVDDICVYEGHGTPPADECDLLSDNESLVLGQEWGNANGNSPGDWIFTEDGIPVSISEISIGSWTGFDVFRVMMDPVGCLDNQVAWVSNLTATYDIASAVAGTDSVTFDYIDWGGSENLQVNGGTLHEVPWLADLDGLTVAPGVYCSVSQDANGCGTLVLVGDVQKLRIGGQEFFLDDVCVYEGEPVVPDECDRLVDHESLTIGQTWGSASGDSPGDLAFTEDGIPVHLGTITLGAYTGFYQAEIVNDPAGCLDNQVMNLNNIANVYDIASAVTATDSVTFLFTDFGGEENLAVNGYPRYEGDITGAPSNIAPGVTCTVYYTDFGNYRCGKVLLVGDVESLLIAGQEFCVDDICVYESTEVPPIECDHEVLFEDEVLGSAWGGGFGNVPGDTIITEDEISVTVDNFWDGYNWVFLNCFIDSAIPGYGVCDGQALFISNVLAGFEVPDLEGGPEVASVSFEFVDWDGIENLQVNGEAPYFGELTSAPVDIATGVTCSVDWWPIASGTAAGIVTLTGDVRSFAIGGQQFYMDNVCVTYATGTGIATSPLGVAPILNHNYPNPFNPKTTLSFSLAEQGEVRLSIHDVLGREVTVLVNGSLNAGNHEKVWDGRDHRGRAVSSGIYFARIEGGGEVQSRKLVLSK